MSTPVYIIDSNSHIHFKIHKKEIHIMGHKNHGTVFHQDIHKGVNAAGQFTVGKYDYAIWFVPGKTVLTIEQGESDCSSEEGVWIINLI